ncbi:hypothetical protein DV736_g2180, partial [Chaetothyriales sp. CBS 134916]
MVAAGTGLAPSRAFMAERAKLAAAFSPAGPQTQTKLNQKQANQLNIVTAFSRTADNRVYVQDRVTQDAQEVLQQLLDEGGSFYICGRTAMTKDASKRVANAVQHEKG